MNLSIKKLGTSEKNKVSYKCVNCGKEITGPTNNVYARRFCSEKCQQEYFT
ncbi:MAG: DUF2116 family Zn-ribbon domain-containing protein [Candidatus Diapherotrites archaeon]|nr:DUF2116 family Zn-ribbon domain-containing protein [Candidatus Diapherotrites archaeon]